MSASGAQEEDEAEGAHHQQAATRSSQEGAARRMNKDACPKIARVAEDATQER